MKHRDKKKAHQQPPSKSVSNRVETDEWPRVRKHLRMGWWSLLLFLSLGILLESMHGFKVQWYIGEQNATRRLMWTLAHAHGTLMSLIHLGYAFFLHVVASGSPRTASIRSWCFTLATLLIPTGFFLGGLVIYDGDPGLGILLVPIGAGLLFAGVLLTALAIEQR